MINLKTNQDIFQGEWKQLQGAVREQWGKLTNDDVAVAQGNWEQMVGQLQARYGYTRADAETRLDAFVNHWNVNVRERSADVATAAQDKVMDTVEAAKSTVSDAAQQTQQVVSDVAQQTQQAVTQTVQQVQDTAVQAGTAVDKKVKRNRWKMMLAMLLIGVGVGYWMSNQ